MEYEPFDDSDADPDYVLSEQESNAEVEQDKAENFKEILKKAPTKEKRKQVRNIDKWKATKRTKETLSGEQHVSKTGNIIKEKFLKPACRPCKKKCSEQINEDERKEIFRNYWDEPKTWDLKRQFIRSHVGSEPIRRERRKDFSRSGKKQTIRYHFDANGKRVEVCKVFFLNTLGVSETVVRTALRKGTTGGFVHQDMRGRHTPPNKLQESVLDQVRAHITSFPVYESHYTREKSAKKYLGSELNTKKMYELYKQKCLEDGTPKNEVVKHWAYKRVFDREFNLGFKKPSNDTCDACDSFILKLKDDSLDQNNKEDVQQAYRDHLDEAERRYLEKRNDKLMSRSTNKTKVIMLDLQKCLPTPYLSNCQSFYLLKLWTLNLTIYDATEKKSYCVTWDESKAGRGGNEIASALLKWAASVLSGSELEHLIIWSDNCPSQNRNIMVLISYFWLLNVCPSLRTVTHKFLLRGHTHMEADHTHALIERTVKKQPPMQIVTPWDWEQLIRSSGATVFGMEVEDFKNFAALYSFPGAPFKNKKNTNKENFLISTVVWMEARAETPSNIFYKTKLEEETFKIVNFSSSVRQRLTLPACLPTIRDTPKGVSKKKKEHLVTLLKWVPTTFHSYYQNIPTASTNDDDEG